MFAQINDNVVTFTWCAHLTENTFESVGVTLRPSGHTERVDSVVGELRSVAGTGSPTS